MWLVAEAERELRNDTWLDLNLALDMSRLQSVAYCHPPNVAAWNCTRYRVVSMMDHVKHTRSCIRNGPCDLKQFHYNSLWLHCHE